MNMHVPQQWHVADRPELWTDGSVAVDSHEVASASFPKRCLTVANTKGLVT